MYCIYAIENQRGSSYTIVICNTLCRYCQRGRNGQINGLWMILQVCWHQCQRWRLLALLSLMWRGCQGRLLWCNVIVAGVSTKFIVFTCLSCQKKSLSDVLWLVCHDFHVVAIIWLTCIRGFHVVFMCKEETLHDNIIDRPIRLSSYPMMFLRESVELMR